MKWTRPMKRDLVVIGRPGCWIGQGKPASGAHSRPRHGGRHC